MSESMPAGNASRVDWDVIVVGGGAAGLFCAANAGQLGCRVAVLEQQPRVGSKILISGGGRCNFTNLRASASNYLTSGSPHFVKSALARFTPQDFVRLVDRHGIAWHEKKLGQLFCDLSSRQIVELLLAECEAGSVRILTSCAPEGVAWNSGLRRYELTTSQGEHTAPALVVATGGLSFPKLGVSPWAYRLASQFGLRVIPPRAGLVPLTWMPADLRRFASLSGLSVDCIASAGNGIPAFRENLLFTHRGLSGPAILQISSYRQGDQPIQLNLIPEINADELLRAGRETGREVRAILRQKIPERLATLIAAEFPDGRPLAQWPLRELNALKLRLQAWEVQPAGDEGYDKAEVTLGGVDTAELSSKTMESRQQPGLYFIGEAVDITGWLGGYNFQWAWSSGWAAAQAIASGGQ
jgi:predicted Rossmann fold flavoprotein